MSLSLLPGFGDKYTTTLSIAGAATPVYTDPLDVTPCAQLAVQINDFSGGGTLAAQAQHSLDGETWDNLDGPVTVADGTILSFDVTDQLIGIFRVGLTETGGGSYPHTAEVIIVGSKLAVL